MSRVELRVYSAAGELVRTLVSGIQPAGYRNVRWDGCDEHSRSVGRGVYYARLVAGTTSLPTKLVKLD
jgi:flagellar hook assembly protein FlgD